ncbi:hypothetical protein ACSBR1_036273 [Camellia fascicularis]
MPIYSLPHQSPTFVYTFFPLFHFISLPSLFPSHNMSPKLSQVLLSTLIFLSTILNFPGTMVAQECPYPCYPPPTGTTGDNPTTPPTTTKAQPIQTGSYPPPPSGYLPYSPPYVGNGNVPPPPDSMLHGFHTTTESLLTSPISPHHLHLSDDRRS